jgi:hypothetical protein
VRSANNIWLTPERRRTLQRACVGESDWDREQVASCIKIYGYGKLDGFNIWARSFLV